MKKFYGEFKKFIMRGNVVDMAVGVIVGGAFTAIVNAMSNHILRPLVNYFLAICFKADNFAEIHTMLKPGYKDVLNDAGEIVGKELDLTQSIYIDWGAFISAVLNFFLIALVLFSIVKLINKIREERKEFKARMEEKTLNRVERKELKANGIKIRDKKAVKEYFAEKKRLAAEEVAKAEAEAEEKARLERLANPTAEDLLKKIIELMEK